MIGRERELATLVGHLGEADRGRGGIVLIAGEAGIGKTRLVEELKAIARSKGFLVLSGSALYESLTPYMPFEDALRSGGLEHLFAEEAPRIEGVYLVTHTGLLVREILREQTRLNPDIFAAMLTTVGGFVEDSLALLRGHESAGTLDRLGHGGYTILIERGQSCNLSVIISGPENEFLIDDMREVLRAVDRSYGNLLRDWDGDDETVRGVERLLEPLIASGNYDGVYYGRENPKARRNLLLDNVAVGLARRARSSPILLCLEDLQWADPSTLALLHHVARTTRTDRVCLVGTYRPEDLVAVPGTTHPLVAAKERIDREGLGSTIELQRLGPEDAAMVVRSLLGGSDVGEALERRIHAETEGNPLFITEIVRLLIDEGFLENRAGSWHPEADIEQMTIPSKIRDALARRLGRLEQGHREILECAAVCGEEFPPDTLAQAMGNDRGELLRALWAIETRHGLIRPRGEKYRFDHVKIKEVLYTELPEDLRKEYHAAIGRAMETRSPNTDAAAGEIAFHYLRSPQPERALPHLLRAASWARKQYANAEAVRFYQEALGLASEPKERKDVFAGLGSVLALVGDLESALDANKKAYELATTPNEKAETLASMAKIHQRRGENSECIRLCNEALVLVGGQETTEEAAALNGLGAVHLEQGEYREALETYSKSLKIREKLGDQAGIAAMLNNIGNVFLGLSEYDRALEHYSRSVPISERIGHMEFLGNHLNNIGVVHFYRGDFEKALEYYGMSRTIKERIGNRLGAASTSSNMAQIHALRGETEKALELLGRNFQAIERIGDPYSAAHALSLIGSAYHEVGDDENALPNLKKSLEIREEINDAEGLVDCLCTLAEIEVSRGNSKPAMEFCARAVSLGSSLGKRARGEALEASGIVLRETARLREAEENLQESLGIFREVGDRFSEARVRYELAGLFKAEGLASRAEVHLRAAIEVFEKTRAEPLLKKARAALEEIGEGSARVPAGR